MKDNLVYLRHILECAVYIAEFTAGGRKEFLQDRKAQDAVLRNLQTLAESTTHISEALRRRHPEVDWRGIAGLRNVLVHNYLGINLERVWNIVQGDLPLLETAVESLVTEIEDEGAG